MAALVPDAQRLGSERVGPPSSSGTGSSGVDTSSNIAPMRELHPAVAWNSRARTAPTWSELSRGPTAARRTWRPARPPATGWNECGGGGEHPEGWGTQGPEEEADGSAGVR